MFGMNPMYSQAPRLGLLARLRGLGGGINWGNLLNNTSRTLNVINQAIPVFYQVKPLFQNAKTMFKIANIIQSDDKESPVTQKNSPTNSIKKEEKISSNQPTFFL